MAFTRRYLSHKEALEWAAYKVYREAEWSRITQDGEKGEMLDVW